MNLSDEQIAASRANETVEQRILHSFGYFGHYMFVKRGGLGGKQHVLKTLYGVEHGRIAQKELLAMTSTTSASLSEVLAKLEREGLIERGRSETDKRQLEIKLTPEGTRMASDLIREEEDFEAGALSVLSPDERAQLIGLLDRIFDDWREKDKQEKEACPCSKN
ncbi:MarR family winged helix-turn-helix transcriptional regulator [Paratractidigestivibacter sp.]|uniref:MarR family winged helix-turn-helix transcriptional regulator n=1 Tax=Paratractidigestivibacter sp. TaxID=2847316 RepID=UPI002ABE4E64|nr:MarR family transcriptional regulator [Paratractidigestivibacter sp.]